MSVGDERGARCPRCRRYAGLMASFCPHCGVALVASPITPTGSSDARHVEVTLIAPPRSLPHRVLRILLTIWLVAYPVISCGPVLLNTVSGATDGGATALGGVLVGGVLAIPWLVGLLVLGLLALLTR